MPDAIVIICPGGLDQREVVAPLAAPELRAAPTWPHPPGAGRVPGGESVDDMSVFGGER